MSEHVSRDYHTKDDTVPLPATMLIDVGEHISQNHSGMAVRLYSNYPFRDRGGPQDEFERRALVSLQASADSGDGVPSYYEFSELKGRSFVRFARAQIMKQSCIECHNGDKTSPKRDWKEGDLAGVLSITRPMDQDIQRTRDGLRGAFALVSTIGIVLFGCSLLYVFISRSRRLHAEAGL